MGAIVSFFSVGIATTMAANYPETAPWLVALLGIMWLTALIRLSIVRAMRDRLMRDILLNDTNYSGEVWK